MKAAVGDPAQLADRVERLGRLDRPVIIELHTAGPGDLDTAADFAASVATIQRLRDRCQPRLFVHVPYQQPAVVTTVPFDRAQVMRTVEFAHAIDAAGVVMHRYYGLVRGGEPVAIPRAEAEHRFQQEVAAVSSALHDRLGFVENLGYFWLRPRAGRRFLTSALDHFFPWEQAGFARFLEDAAIGNLTPMVDIAHATLSANMFNALRRHPDRFGDDPRFGGIIADDLARSDWLRPADFVAAQPRYLHLSDALFLDRDAIATLPDQPDDALLHTALTSESLPIGAGNLDFTEVLGKVAGALVIVEVDPYDGQSHESNSAQEDAVQRLVRLESGGGGSRPAMPFPPASGAVYSKLDPHLGGSPRGY